MSPASRSLKPSSRPRSEGFVESASCAVAATKEKLQPMPSAKSVNAYAATLETQKSARTIALDAGDHRLFLAAARFEETGTPSRPGHRPPMVPGSFAILVVAPPVADGGQTGR